MAESFPNGSVVKNLPVNSGDTGEIHWSGIAPGGGNENPFQYSYLESPTDRGAWWATVHGVARESYTTEHTHTHIQGRNQTTS